MIETNERIIRLTAATPLPCGVVRDGDFCGRDAFAGWAHPSGFKTAGRRWVLLPICPLCLKDLGQLFKDSAGGEE
jgi:hypothetical protein